MAVPLSLLFQSPSDAGERDVSRRGAGQDERARERAAVSRDDEELVARVKAGDLTAFEGVFRAWHAELCTFAARYLHSVDIAEDVVEDVFASLWLRRDAWEPRAGVRAYLFGAVRNRALTTLRDVGRRTEAASVAANTIVGDAVPDDNDEQLTRVWNAVTRLPEMQRAVVTMRWQGELTFLEIAAALGSSPAAVKMQLSRAMRTLRGWLAEG